MATKTKAFKVPFDGHGNQLHYQNDIGKPPEHLALAWKEEDHDLRATLIRERDDWYEKARQRTWRDNYIFTATMTVVSMSRGRSAAYFHLIDERGKQYTMFMTDMVDMVKRARMITQGVVTGRWTFQKRGNNYGVKLVD